MGVLYSIYDALVSINVPNDKARAVADAMEMDMLEKLTTKSDLAHVQALLSKDIQGCASKLQLVEFARSLTTQMYLAIGGSVVLTCSILGTLLVLLR